VCIQSGQRRASGSVDLTKKNQKRQVSSIGDSRELLELERIRRLLPDPELQAQKPSAVKKARREEAFDKEREKNRLRLKINLPFCQSLSGELSNELRKKLQGIVNTALQTAIQGHFCVLLMILIRYWCWRRNERWCILGWVSDLC
jgi:hypothetical protein